MAHLGGNAKGEGVAGRLTLVETQGINVYEMGSLTLVRMQEING